MFVDLTTELLRQLGHHKDFRCVMDYAPAALEIEPSMQEAYYWTIVAAEGMGNGAAREKAFEKARIELIPEEYSKLMRVLAASGHATEDSGDNEAENAE